jgi:acetolactate synthase-1/2/3 large subunit
MNKIRLVDYVATRLVAFGVKDVFLVTGGGAMHLNDALSRNKALTCTCFHHEQAAAIACEAYNRLSRKIPVLNVTTGPGGINSLNGVFGAYVDSLSMIVLSGQVKRETYVRSTDIPLRQLGDQEVDIVSMAKLAVKYAVTVFEPINIRKVLDIALHIAVTGRPGPVWIDIPIDVQAALIDPERLDPFDFNWHSLISDSSLPPNTANELRNVSKVNTTIESDLKTLLVKLSAAKRPIILCGTGLRSAGCVREFLEVINMLGAPVVTAWNAHDVVCDEHPLYIGRPGTVGDRAGNFAVQGADFLLILGCRLNIRQISYNYKNFAPQAFKVMVDIDDAELRKPTLTIDLRVLADLKVFLTRLKTSLVHWKTKSAHTGYLNWCKDRRKKYSIGSQKYIEKSDCINPYQFLLQFFRDLDQAAIVIAGNGSACVMGFQAANLKSGQRLFTNSGNASMGYDLPAAIGASVAAMKKRVFCVTGDGSVMMNIQELQTIVTNNLPIKIIILNNNGYASIRQTQQAYFPDNPIGCDPTTGVEFPDFCRVASAFGISAISVKSLRMYNSDTVRELLDNERPALIEVFCDSEQGFMPKLTSKKLEDGTMQSPSLEDMAPFLPKEELVRNMPIE